MWYRKPPTVLFFFFFWSKLPSNASQSSAKKKSHSDKFRFNYQWNHVVNHKFIFSHKNAIFCVCSSVRLWKQFFYSLILVLCSTNHFHDMFYLVNLIPLLYDQLACCQIPLSYPVSSQSLLDTLHGPKIHKIVFHNCHIWIFIFFFNAGVYCYMKIIRVDYLKLIIIFDKSTTHILLLLLYYSNYTTTSALAIFYFLS